MRETCLDLLAAVAVPFSDRDSNDPGVTFHSPLMTLVDTKLQGVVAGRLSGIACHTDIPRFHGGGKNGAGTHSCLYENGVDIGFLQLVEDVGELLLLPIGGVGVGPVEAFDGGEPDGSDFMLGSLCGNAQ